MKVNQEHKNAICSTLLVTAIAFASEAQSAITSFTDSAAFVAAVGSIQVYNFDSFALNQGPDVGGYFQPLDQQLPGIDFDNARINFGGFGGTFRSPSNVVLNADFVNPIIIKFSTPRFAVGLFNTSIVDAARFDVFDANNSLLGSINLGAQGINFGGFTSDIGIARASVTPIAPTNGSIYIDDLMLAAGAAVPARLTVMEFYHPQFSHYFITAYPDEAAFLGAGNLPPWVPTGQTFKVWSAAGTNITNVCRFFNNEFAPRSSHFYSHSDAECPSLASRSQWTLEASNAFYMMPSPTGTCPSGTMALYRLYNNGMSGAPNHRYTTYPSVRAAMLSVGWVPEGNGPTGVFACVPQ